MVTGGLRPEVDQATLQVTNGSLVLCNIYPYILIHTVIDNSSIVTVNSEENVVLSCVEPTAIVPSSRVVWIKDGIEMTEKVRVIVSHCHAWLPHTFV